MFKTFCLLLTLCAPAAPPQTDENGDALLGRIVQNLRGDETADLWDKSLTAERLIDSRGRERPVSGDRRMGEILAVYTRARLDAGGWTNELAGRGYAADNALLLAAIGDGVMR